MFKGIDNIEFHVTDNCNLNCSYCYLKKGDIRTANNDLSNKLFDTFWEKYISSAKERSLAISFWGGEPLLNFDVVKHIITTVENIKIKNNYFLIVTNGTSISPEIAEFCSSRNIRLQITLDGDEESHDFYRNKNGHGTYRNIVKNIKLLDKFQIKYNIRTTITYNSSTILNIVSSFKKVGINGASFGIVTPNFLQQDDFIPIKGQTVAFDLFNSFLNDFNRKNIFFYWNFYKILNKIFTDNPCISCGVSKNKILINHHGDIYPCHRFVNSPEFCIGNIHDGINNKFKILYNTVWVKNKNCQSCWLAGVFCGGPCLYEILKRGIDYIQDDICEFNRFFYKKTLIFITKLFLLDRDGYNRLLQKYLGVDMEIFNIGKIDDNTKISDGDIVFCRLKDAKVVDLDEEGIIYAASNFGKKYIANTTAMAIWDLLDGQRTAQQIAQEIASVCEVEFEAIKDDIYGQLAAFQELGFVEEVPAASHA